MSVANGTGKPRLVITKASGEVVTLDLPMPQVGSGEDPNEVSTVHDAFDHESIVDYDGYKPRFMLNYSGGIDGVELIRLHHLLARSKTKIELIPHIDLPQRKFEVRLLRFGLIERVGNDGHRGVRLEFESTKVLDAIPFPQASLSGRRWQDMGTETWAQTGAGYIWHFFL